MTTFTPETVPLDDVLLDPNNFRFQGDSSTRKVSEKRFTEEGVQAAALARLKSDGLTELRQSIASNGFVPVERIVVRKLADSDKYVVVEGNRRAATLKMLRDEHDAGIDHRDDLIATFDKVPVLVLESDDDSTYLAIMGIRHVGGIKEWGGYQSAQLVHELRADHGLSTQEVASRLGLSAVEANRRYRAFRAMEQMRGSEEHGEEVNSDMYPLFHEALVSPRVRQWLEWEDSSAEFKSEEQREHFYSLITPYTDTRGVRRPAKITSYSEVRELKSILDNEDAFQSLLDLEKPFSDASALVKSADVGKNWIAKVKAAITALDHMGIRESKQLGEAEKEKLQELSDLIRDLLEAAE